MPLNVYLLMAVQFLAALADNALLIVAIARLGELDAPAWAIPLLKLSFVLSYVLLAPFVGPLADTWRKGRVMLAANALKLLAVGLLLLGVPPLWGLALAGLGAAMYAPAKYGLVCELLPAEQLVSANGLIEACTVCAVVLGTVLGGALVGDLLLRLHAQDYLPDLGLAASTLAPALWILLVLYGLAGLFNLGVADSGARYPRQPFHPWAMVQRFFAENRLLWRDPLGRISMAVTTLLWGTGACLQLIVLRWTQQALGLGLDQASYLQGVSASGVIVGAVLASRTMSLERAVQVLPLGMLMGVLVPVMCSLSDLPSFAVLLVIVGGMAGFFVVPMNALLQHRGHALLTAGRSIAVQGFNENGGILLMLALYAGLTALAIDLRLLVWCFGLLVAGSMALITLWRQRWLRHAS